MKETEGKLRGKRKLKGPCKERERKGRKGRLENGGASREEKKENKSWRMTGK